MAKRVAGGISTKDKEPVVNNPAPFDWLGEVTDEVIHDEGLALFLYGPPKIGKSTLGSFMPNPLFLPTDPGLKKIKAKKGQMIRNFRSLDKALQEIKIGDHNYKSLIIDTMTGIERILSVKVAQNSGKSSIEDMGFGKGYAKLAEAVADFINILEDIRSERNMNVLLISHSHIKPIHDPSVAESYDHHEPELHKRTWPVIKQWVDAILFTHTEVFIDKENRKGIQGDRVIETGYSPAWEAGNRLGWPEQIPLDGEKFCRLIECTRSNRDFDVPF